MGIVYEQQGEDLLAYIVIDSVKYFVGRCEVPANFIEDGYEDM